MLQKVILENGMKAGIKSFESGLSTLDHSLRDLSTHIFNRFLSSQEQQLITRDIQQIIDYVSNLVPIPLNLLICLPLINHAC